MTNLPQSLPHAFLQVAKTSPDKTFVHFEGRAYSYEEICAHVSVAAGRLAGWGLGRGDRVALVLGNSPSFIIAYLSVLWAGGVVVPVNTRYRAGEVRHVLQDSGARLVLTDAAGRDEVEKARGDTSVRIVVLGGSLEEDAAAWRALASSEVLAEPLALQNDLAVIGYTSGTTGRSKGATLSHHNFLANSAAVTQAWGWTADDHLLLVLPLFHMHGLGVGLHGTFFRGAKLTLKRAFDAADVLDELYGGRVTMFFGVPTLYTRLLEGAETTREKPPHLRLLISGSAPLSPRTLLAVEQTFGLRILERYGMTETVMNLGNPLVGERRAGSVGVPFEGVDVRIADPKSNVVLEQGETGEIRLRGPNVTQGYWRNPEATAAAFTPDGWFRTGDLGFVDHDGYYFISGRAKELIISGGFNIYPRELEDLIMTLPGVTEVAVVGLPDEDLGEKVVAAVVGSISPERVQAFCKEHLASFKKPREVVLVERLPRNALGKVRKHKVLEELSKTS